MCIKSFTFYNKHSPTDSESYIKHIRLHKIPPCHDRNPHQRGNNHGNQDQTTNAPLHDDLNPKKVQDRIYKNVAY